MTEAGAASSDGAGASASSGFEAAADGAATDRATALGIELIEVHDWLRQSLQRLRADLSGSGAIPAKRTRSLRAHCMGFCAALTRHHQGEDRAAFPLLAAAVPELADVLLELERDHHLVGQILRRIELLAQDFGPGNAQDIRSELDGLAAILDSHFRWEERRLVNALNSVSAPARTAEHLFGVPVRPA